MYVLIDDDPLIRMVFEDIMNAEGHETHAFEGVEDATSVLESRDIEGLIIDYHLRDQSGVELVGRLKQEGYLSAQPIMVMSSDTSEEVIQDCESHHLQFVSKSDPDLFAKIYSQMCLQLN